MKDKCIICGEETAYDVTTHIDYRRNYVEGAGQVCEACATGNSIPTKEPIEPEDIIFVPTSKIKELSNNFDLGRYVRGLFNSRGK